MPVYKDSKSGLWYYILELGKDENGKRKQIKKRGFISKDEAKLALAEAEIAVSKQTYVPPQKVKYAEFLEQWFESKQTANNYKSTLTTYRNYMKNHILPALGNYEVQKLNVMILQKFYNNLSVRLAPASIKKIHIIIHNSLELAVKWNIISQNPAKLIETPKLKRKEMKVWEAHEAKHFLEVAKEDRLYIACLLALMAGVRQGELLALRWQDVDFKKKRIYITQTLSHDGKEIVPDAKSDAGIRSVAISKRVVAALKEHKKEQAKERLKSDGQWQDHGLVVCTKVGTPKSPRNLLRVWYRLLKKSELPEIRFHDLRHTCATLLLKQGMSPKVVAERLGHADIEILLNTYAHVLPSMQEAAAEMIENVIFEAAQQEDTEENQG